MIHPNFWKANNIFHPILWLLTRDLWLGRVALRNVFILILRGDYVVNHGNATQLPAAKMHLEMDYPTPRNFCYTLSRHG